MMQMQRPNIDLSTNICMMCMHSAENGTHWFLICQMAVSLSNKLFGNIWWESCQLVELEQFLLLQFKGFGHTNGRSLWKCAVYEVIWNVFLEWNAHIFRGISLSLDHLWAKILFAASLWCLAQGFSGECPFWICRGIGQLCCIFNCYSPLPLPPSFFLLFWFCNLLSWRIPNRPYWNLSSLNKFLRGGRGEKNCN